MPKTPIDENSKTSISKNKVGLARQICVATPAFDALTAKR